MLTSLSTWLGDRKSSSSASNLNFSPLNPSTRISLDSNVSNEIGWSLFPASFFFTVEAMENQFSVERARLKLISIILSYLMLLSLSFSLYTTCKYWQKVYNKQTGIKYHRAAFIFLLLFASKASLCAKAKGRWKMFQQEWEREWEWELHIHSTKTSLLKKFVLRQQESLFPIKRHVRRCWRLNYAPKKSSSHQNLFAQEI